MEKKLLSVHRVIERAACERTRTRTMHLNRNLIPALAAIAAVSASTGATAAESRPAPAPASATITYADIADLADAAPMVVRAQPRKVVAVEPERAKGVKPGFGRFYIEAKTESVVAGTQPLGQLVRYLVDLTLDAKGKPPKFKKQSVILFARPVIGRPDELQLIRPDAQMLSDAPLDQRLRDILKELYAPGAAHKVTGVREAIFVPGNLAGESESQFFLSTANGEPAAIAVHRSPDQAPRWSVSFTELVSAQAEPPARDSLAWYRLACFLPGQLPAGANISSTPSDRSAAARDYRFVMEQLGSCPRSRN